MNTVEQFNSITEMLDILNNRPNNEAMENEYASKENSKSFTGSESYEEACKLCKYGYKEILPNLKKEMNKAEKSLNKLFIHQQQFNQQQLSNRLHRLLHKVLQVHKVQQDQVHHRQQLRQLPHQPQQ